MTTTEPLQYYERADAVFGDRFRLERLVAVSRERALFLAEDRILRRPVSLRINFYTDDVVRRWFLVEAEALAQLDHPAIRHIYEAGVVQELAYRVGNWVDGEGLDEAGARGPRPVPTVHTLARDLLGAMEHAHTHGIVLRRIVPAALLLTPAGRGVVTDLRYCSWTLPVIPADDVPSGQAYMAPEVRRGAPGDPASDVYTAGAILYYAITGSEPPADPAAVRRPSELRPACPRAIDRIVMRALRPAAEDRYLTASEMLEDFASDAGTFETPAATGTAVQLPREDRDRWEKRLRRALGDDYELLGELGTGGFGRVYRVRDLHLEREVALKVLNPLLTQDPTVVERFRREAQLAARLHHPNIVDIYDIAGRSGLLWYTMELINGPSLAQLVEREGPLPLDRVLRILREALSALAHAHGSGLVHRDIKPENMLIAPDGALRITDFGLALAAAGPGKVRRRHQPERDAAVRQPRAAAGRTGGSAHRPLQPRRRGVLHAAGLPAVHGAHARAGSRQADHRPASLAGRAARCQRRASGGARARAAERGRGPIPLRCRVHAGPQPRHRPGNPHPPRRLGRKRLEMVQDLATP